MPLKEESANSQYHKKKELVCTYPPRKEWNTSKTSNCLLEKGLDGLRDIKKGEESNLLT